MAAVQTPWWRTALRGWFCWSSPSVRGGWYHGGAIPDPCFATPSSRWPTVTFVSAVGVAKRTGLRVYGFSALTYARAYEFALRCADLTISSCSLLHCRATRTNANCLYVSSDVTVSIYRGNIGKIYSLLCKERPEIYLKQGHGNLFAWQGITFHRLLLDFSNFRKNRDKTVISFVMSSQHRMRGRTCFRCIGRE